jgi:hypothetical protein
MRQGNPKFPLIPAKAGTQEKPKTFNTKDTMGAPSAPVSPTDLARFNGAKRLRVLRVLRV